MIRKSHIHLAALLAAIGAGATALSGALPADLSDLPLVVLAVSAAVTSAINVYESKANHGS